MAFRNVPSSVFALLRPAFFILLLLALTGSALGQEVPRHILSIKGGSDLKGTMIEKTGNGSIMFQLESGEITEVPYSQIISLTRYRPVNETPAQENTFKTRRFFHIIETGIGFPISTIYTSRYSSERASEIYFLRSVNGYQFSRHFSAGLGLGLENFGNSTLIPVTIDGRIAFSKSYFSPMLNLNLGHAFNLGKVGGDFTVNPSLGFRGYFNNKNALLVNLGYRWLKTHISIAGGRPAPVLVQFITLSVGSTF